MNYYDRLETNWWIFSYIIVADNKDNLKKIFNQVLILLSEERINSQSSCLLTNNFYFLILELFILLIKMQP